MEVGRGEMRRDELCSVAGGGWVRWWGDWGEEGAKGGGEGLLKRC